MKLLNCALIAFLLILPTGCWWLEDDDCTKLSKEITIRIYSEIIDYSEDQSRGEHAYAIDFYKDHCGGGPSGQMSYLHKGLYQSDERWYVKKEGIGTWDITFKYEEDMLNVNLVEDNSKITPGSISGKQIYEYTDGGKHGLLILAVLFDGATELGFGPT